MEVDGQRPVFLDQWSVDGLLSNWSAAFADPRVPAFTYIHIYVYIYIYIYIKIHVCM